MNAHNTSHLHLWFFGLFSIFLTSFIVFGSMDQIILVCGNWRFDQNHWFFLVDKSLGCKVMQVREDIPYDEFMRMVSEDFDLNLQRYKLKLSYISKELMHGLPPDTPPIVVTNERQLGGYLQQFRKEAIRLCVEISNISHVAVEEGYRFQPNSASSFGDSTSGRQSSTAARVRQTVKKEGDKDAEMRFDYCEDVDGASSGDDEFVSVKKRCKEEDCNLPPKKRDSRS